MCRQEGEEKEQENVLRVMQEPEWWDRFGVAITQTGVGLVLGSTMDPTLYTRSDYGIAYVTTSAAYSYGTSNDFSAPSITTGTNAALGAGVYFEAKCPNGCSEVVIIEVFHVEKKPGNRTVPATDGLACGVPPCPPAADGIGDHHVNRWAPGGSQQPPWLPGSSEGRPGSPAVGHNYPPKVIDITYRVVFEACAYCSAKPGDTLYQKYLGCQTFAYDPALSPPWTDPKPSDQPSHEFNLTLDQWRIDHGPF